MKRSTFLKRLVMGAVAVPAVVAASKDSPAYPLKKINSSVIGKSIPLDEHGNAYAGIMYDQSGNGNHAYKINNRYNKQ